jgi:two-component system NtrC family sensor kinase
VADRLGQALVLVEHAAQRARVAVELDVPADLEVVGDPGKLDQVVLNLVSNAVEASAGAGSRVRVSGARAPDGVRLVVEDDGPGIPPALRERVFEPLFTTRPGTGTGLGLPICRDLVHAAYGGRLELAPSERGARFELWLPDGGALAMARPAWEPASTDPAVAAAA